MPPAAPLSRRRFTAACLARWLVPGALGPWGRQAVAGGATPPPLMLAREAPDGIDPAGFLVSEKFDGVRAHWDGHGLRLRSGRPIAAPAWFTQRLPALPLDGELWLGHGRFEALAAAVRRSRPMDAEWRQLHYLVFDLPAGAGPFAERAARLAAALRQVGWAPLQAVEQHRLPDRAALQRRLDAVVRAGGEGLMLHRADAPHTPGRSDALLKLKPLHDAEAMVVGHVAGRGRHAGRLGALHLRRADGVEFLVGTGFSDAQRDHPPPRGAVVSYSHRGHTAAGLPRFASFLRVRELP